MGTAHFLAMASRSYQPPADFVDEGGQWPVGPFVAQAPVYARVTAALVVHLRAAIGEQSLRSVAVPAGIDPTSLSRLLTGKVVPDLATIAALEQVLDVDLWPGRV